MTKACITAASIFAASAAFAETINFDGDSPGGLPVGWEQGVTGKGNPKWAVRADAGAPSKPNVLEQSGSGTFPWCVLRKTSMENGFVEVRFKPISGREDASGGIVFRFAEGRYYLIRANALEDNFRFYYYDRSRSMLSSARVRAPALGEWHTVRAVAVGDRVQGWLDGTLLLNYRDQRFKAGRVGLWTKADSITAFDQFSIRGIAAV